jgi:putative phosphoesterase
MRILVVADIHGNRAALEAIREPFDLCVCVGDLVDYGPEPAACVDWVRGNAMYCVRGNHDHGVAQQVQIHGYNGFRFLTANTRPVSIASLAPDQRKYLAGLPTSAMFAAGGKRFLVVHATPRDPMDEYAPADAAFWTPRLAGIHVDYVIVGHTHVPYTLRVNGTTVVNPGSVGLSRDGDPRAAYAVIENGEVLMKRIEYPVDETVAATERVVSDPAAVAMLASIFRYGAQPGKPLLRPNGNGSENGSADGE